MKILCGVMDKLHILKTKTMCTVNPETSILLTVIDIFKLN